MHWFGGDQVESCVRVYASECVRDTHTVDGNAVWPSIVVSLTHSSATDTVDQRAALISAKRVFLRTFVAMAQMSSTHSSFRFEEVQSCF